VGATARDGPGSDLSDALAVAEVTGGRVFAPLATVAA
jgi:hypothetical protein